MFSYIKREIKKREERETERERRGERDIRYKNRNLTISTSNDHKF
jgi:hypothetical protein